jgi:3-dehydroquinate synthase
MVGLEVSVRSSPRLVWYILREMKNVRVSLKNRSYDVKIGSDVTRSLGFWMKGLVSDHTPRRAFVFSDDKLTAQLNSVIASLKKHKWEVHSIPVKSGENLKSIKSIYPLYEELLNRRADRKSFILAIGGGTIGDAIGFLAATYMRGTPWVCVPTTLLSQVDSALGGKTGINHKTAKNIIGSIYQPRLVVCDLQHLETLDDREIVSGFGEMIKYGIVFDPNYYHYLSANFKKLLARESRTTSHAIERSLFWKSKVVTQDEFDTLGIRETLNFGHTFGHALETVTDYKRFRHGEAVIWGMRFALSLSLVKERLLKSEYMLLDSFLSGLPVPRLPQNLNVNELIAAMASDKKSVNRKVKFVLLEKLGKTVSEKRITHQNLVDAYTIMTQITKP